MSKWKEEFEKRISELESKSRLNKAKESVAKIGKIAVGWAGCNFAKEVIKIRKDYEEQSSKLNDLFDAEGQAKNIQKHMDNISKDVEINRLNLEIESLTNPIADQCRYARGNAIESINKPLRDEIDRLKEGLKIRNKAIKNRSDRIQELQSEISDLSEKNKALASMAEEATGRHVGDYFDKITISDQNTTIESLEIKNNILQSQIDTLIENNKWGNAQKLVDKLEASLSDKIEPISESTANMMAVNMNYSRRIMELETEIVKLKDKLKSKTNKVTDVAGLAYELPKYLEDKAYNQAIDDVRSECESQITKDGFVEIGQVLVKLKKK